MLRCNGETSMSRSSNLCQYLERSAVASPDRRAVVDPSGVPLTYRELDELSDRVAGFLVERGVQPGDRVGVIAPKSASVVATLFGIMKAGAAYEPGDCTAPAARNRMLLADCAVKAVFLHPECEAIVRDWPSADIDMPTVVWLDGRKPAARGFPGASLPAIPR